MEVGALGQMSTGPPVDLLNHAILKVQCQAVEVVCWLHIEGCRDVRAMRLGHLAVEDAAYEHPLAAELRCHVAVAEVWLQRWLHEGWLRGIQELPGPPSLCPPHWHLWIFPCLEPLGHAFVTENGCQQNTGGDSKGTGNGQERDPPQRHATEVRRGRHWVLLFSIRHCFVTCATHLRHLHLCRGDAARRTWHGTMLGQLLLA
mmetsp:Transcript_26379/g.53441  ORF Transcript_26379/g.53441 Transcript_26379/m.53441 type:complete len:202 (+) Transcript_26379:1461-2066(+)